MSKFLRLASMLLAALPLLLPAPALADPPARVGRLAHVENDVDFRLERHEAPAPATRNWPISSGAVLETGERGRAEVWVDSTAFRLGGDSQVEFSTIDDRQVVLEVVDGRLAISILEAEQANDLLVRLPEGTIRFARAGRYRLDVGSEHSEVTALAGLASIEYAGGRTQLAAGNKATLFAGGGLRIGAAERPDGFDRWVAERENATQAPLARRHVSPYMTGYQDLDAYGDWNAHDEYGSIWYPRAVAADWAPYRFGRWAWVAPWGWTWIDAAPWGFAPFHYGRWVLIHGRWAWVPGRRAVRPVYAPALVAWIGEPGWSVSFSFGAAPAVGWFPLAPREVYVPSYRHSPTYIRNVNVTHVHNVTVIDRAARSRGHERYAHRASPQAVTVVPASQLREGKRITEREYRRLDRQDLGRAPVAAVSGREWLNPGPEARRPRADERRETVRRDERREADGRDAERASRRFGADSAPSRQSAPLTETAPAARRDFREPPANDRPEAERRRDRVEQRQGERDEVRRSPAVPTNQPHDAPAIPLRAEERSAPRAAESRRERPEERRGERETVRQERALPRSGDAPQFRPPEAQPVVRQAPPPAVVRERPERREMREAPRPQPAFVDSPPVRRHEDFRPPPPVMRSPEAVAPAAGREARGGRERDSAERGGRGGDRGERGDHDRR